MMSHKNKGWAIIIAAYVVGSYNLVLAVGSALQTHWLDMSSSGVMAAGLPYLAHTIRRVVTDMASWDD